MSSPRVLRPVLSRELPPAVPWPWRCGVNPPVGKPVELTKPCRRCEARHPRKAKTCPHCGFEYPSLGGMWRTRPDEGDEGEPVGWGDEQNTARQFSFAGACLLFSGLMLLGILLSKHGFTSEALWWPGILTAVGLLFILGGRRWREYHRKTFPGGRRK